MPSAPRAPRFGGNHNEPRYYSTDNAFRDWARCGWWQVIGADDPKLNVNGNDHVWGQMRLYEAGIIDRDMNLIRWPAGKAVGVAFTWAWSPDNSALGRRLVNLPKGQKWTISPVAERVGITVARGVMRKSGTGPLVLDLQRARRPDGTLPYRANWRDNAYVSLDRGSFVPMTNFSMRREGDTSQDWITPEYLANCANETTARFMDAMWSNDGGTLTRADWLRWGWCPEAIADYARAADSDLYLSFGYNAVPAAITAATRLIAAGLPPGRRQGGDQSNETWGGIPGLPYRYVIKGMRTGKLLFRDPADAESYGYEPAPDPAICHAFAEHPGFDNDAFVARRVGVPYAIPAGHLFCGPSIAGAIIWRARKDIPAGTLPPAAVRGDNRTLSNELFQWAGSGNYRVQVSWDIVEYDKAAKAGDAHFLNVFNTWSFANPIDRDSTDAYAVLMFETRRGDPASTALHHVDVIAGAPYLALHGAEDPGQDDLTAIAAITDPNPEVQLALRVRRIGEAEAAAVPRCAALVTRELAGMRALMDAHMLKDKPVEHWTYECGPNPSFNGRGLDKEALVHFASDRSRETLVGYYLALAAAGSTAVHYYRKGPAGWNTEQPDRAGALFQEATSWYHGISLGEEITPRHQAVRDVALRLARR